MIFQSKKMHAAGRATQLFAGLRNAIRTRLETSLMWNFTGATIPATATVKINAGGNRRIELTTPASDEQFGIAEQSILTGTIGIVRRQGLARVRLDATTDPPVVGYIVNLSATTNGYGHVGAGAVPIVGQITDADEYTALNPYVTVLLRRCTCPQF